MRIVTSAQMRQIEQAAFDSGVAQPDLMRRAGRAVADRALATLNAAQGAHALVLVGPRNNGGDGLVAAEALLEAGVREVTVWLYGRDGLQGAPVAADLLERVTVIHADAADANTALTAAVAQADLIIDAIYGIGGRDELPDDLIAAMLLVNARNADPAVQLVALDIPTGVSADTGMAADAAFRANLTVSLGRPKVGLYQPAGMRAVGRIAIEEIGLAEGALPDEAPRLIGRADAAIRLPRRAFDAHKGDAGSLMIIGGSLNYLGAPVLSAHAALRAGVGLLSLAVPRSILGPIATQVPESTYLPLPEAEWGTIGREAVKSIVEVLERYTALQIGNGLGRDKATGEFLANLFAFAQRDRPKGPVGFRPSAAEEAAATEESPVKVPVLFDADGLNLLSEVENWWERLSSLQLILTPHHGELARLRKVERAAISAAPWQAARDAARDWGQTIVLKGGYTIVATPTGELWVAPLANPALAAAGTGDTLAGLIAGLLAQGLAPDDAAILGVWIGARAADLASAEIGILPLVAGDLPRFIGQAIVELERGTTLE
ncbi:MAG TPA: NAD(P)H-hydrate dehydratase [Thermomicrobiales bacterium]|jgi:NAD(P)H-hydrate epimerase